MGEDATAAPTTISLGLDVNGLRAGKGDKDLLSSSATCLRVVCSVLSSSHHCGERITPTRKALNKAKCAVRLQLSPGSTLRAALRRALKAGAKKDAEVSLAVTHMLCEAASAFNLILSIRQRLLKRVGCGCVEFDFRTQVSSCDIGATSRLCGRLAALKCIFRTGPVPLAKLRLAFPPRLARTPQAHQSLALRPTVLLSLLLVAIHFLLTG